MTVKGPNDTEAEIIPLIKLRYTENGYKITRQLSAQQMGENSVIQLFNKEGAVQTLYTFGQTGEYGTSFTYGPKDYFATVKNGTEYSDELKALCTAMERYGEYGIPKIG